MSNFIRQYLVTIRTMVMTLVSSGALLLVTVLALGSGSAPATVAFVFLTIITLSAYFGNLVVSVVASLVATLCFDYFFLVPFGTLDVSSPGDWISLGAFLLISVVISKLTSSAARTRETNANLTGALGNLTALAAWLAARQDGELSLTAIAGETVKLFRFQYCSLHVYSRGRWDHAFGSAVSPLTQQVEDRVQNLDQPLDWTVMVAESDLGVRYVPIQHRDETWAVLAVKDDRALPQTLRTLAYLIGSRLTAR